MRTSLRRVVLAAAALLLAAALPAQQRQQPLDATTAAALQRLAITMADKRAGLERALASSDEALARRLKGELDNLRFQFAGLAAHLDVKEFEQPSQRKFDLQGELEELLRPLLRALKDATAGPRQVADLQARREFVEEQLAIARAAAQAVQQTRDALPSDSAAHVEAQREFDDHWRPLLDDLGRELLVINATLRRLEEAQQPLVDSVTDSVQVFVQNSGLNVVLAVLVFLITYFGLGFVTKLLLRSRQQRGFSVRLIEVLLRVMTVLVAIAATMVVPYARNDWLLLAVGIVFLIGAGWVIVKMAPQYFEQIRLVLNVGPVREGERLLIQGLPYRVDALRFYSRLVNPDLSGGLLRVPIKDLIGQRSRPLGHDEPWFPCQEGDVVALADGVVGEVQLQTPEVVVVTERHDAPRSYPTLAFLEQNPRNLSHGFEIVVSFGIDYRHQPDVASKVPGALRAAVAAGLDDLIDEHELRAVRVELESAGNSSLNFAVIVELDGSAASRYHELHRRVNTLLVTACSQHGFGIPFPQLTLHRS